VGSQPPITPHLALIHEDRVPPELFARFREAIEADGLDLEVETVPSAGPTAGTLWLLPTAVMLFIGKSYFDAFLSEMGRDHYKAFKEGVKALRTLLSYVKVTLVGTAGKVPKNNAYSHFYSIWLLGDDGQQLKFLVPNECTEAEGDRIMETFMDFVRRYYADELDPQEAATLKLALFRHGPILLALNPETEKIGHLNPFTEEFLVPPEHPQSE
jgi:hypothetical protein